MSETPTGYQAGEKREGAGSAFVQIILVAALAGGGLFFYKGNVDEKKRVAALTKEARVAARTESPSKLLEARAKFEETGKHKEDPRIIAELAEIAALLYYEYGMADMQAVAQEYVQLAKDKDLKKESRYVAEAYLLLAQGQAVEAENLLEEFRKKFGDLGKLMHAVAEAKLMQGKPEEAQQAAEIGMKVSSNLIRLPLVHGDAFVAQGKYGAAQQSYKKASTMNAGHVGMLARNVRLSALRRSKKPKYIRVPEAKEVRNQLEGNTPRISALLTYAVAESYYSEGNLKKAMQTADKALKENERMYDAMALRGRIFVRRKKSKDAIQAFDALLKAVPTSLTHAQTAFFSLHTIGKGKEGVKYLENLHKTAPENQLVLPALSVAYAQIGDAKKADEMAKKAVKELGDGRDIALFAEARSLQAAKKGDDAIKKYQEAFKASANGAEWPELHFAMAELSLDGKDAAAAESSFVKAASLWEKKNAPVDVVIHAYVKAFDAAKAQGRKAKPRMDIYKKRLDKLRKDG